MAVAFEYIIVIILASILVVLLVVFCLASLIFVKKRQILCFKRGSAAKPYIRADQQLQAGYGLVEEIKPKSRRVSGLKKGKRGDYQRLEGRPPSASKRDPFANELLENPLVHEEELTGDWSNPAFDTERSQLYDAAVTLQSWYRMRRQRTPFVHLRQSVVVIQAMYRGWKVRTMLPQLKKEKHQRDQQRKKLVSWKRKGTLAALKFYDVKGYGFAEVEQLYGLETIRSAADQLKKLYGGKGKMRLKLFISVKGIKLFDYYTMEHFATVKIPSVSFCSVDPKNKKIFAFINRKKRRCFCHIFQASEQDAQKMVETTSEAFDVTFRRMELRRAQKEEQRRAQNEHTRGQLHMARENLRKAQLRKAFHHHSQELDVEVASMIEMAESGSAQNLNNHPQQEVHTAEVLSATTGGAGSPRGRPRRDSPPPATQEHIASRLASKAETRLLDPIKRNGPVSGSAPSHSDPTVPTGRRSRSSTGSSGSGLRLSRKASPRTAEEAGQPRENLRTPQTGIEDFQRSTL